MRKSIPAGLLAMAIGLPALSGCQSSPESIEATRNLPPVDAEMDGGMSRTGSGSDSGASASGMDRAGGGMRGSDGINSSAGGTRKPGQ